MKVPDVVKTPTPGGGYQTAIDVNRWAFTLIENRPFALRHWRPEHGKQKGQAQRIVALYFEITGPDHSKAALILLI
jgi:hypothetical protein